MVRQEERKKEKETGRKNPRNPDQQEAMQPKNNRIRVLGQRSITSTFLFRPSLYPSKENWDSGEKDSDKGSSISLSDFLDRKLNRTPGLSPKTVKGKSRPFWSPVGPGDDDVGGSRSGGGKIGDEKEGKERNSVLDEVVFEQFKHNIAEKGDVVVGLSSEGEGGTSGGSDAHGSCFSLTGELGTGKRSNPSQVSQGGEGKPAPQKHSLVLGGDPTPKRRVREEQFSSTACNKRPRHLYNHYANGGGWWDCGMEGVDSEEVGHGEIWEGIGSTTFGGIEWH